MSKTILMQPWGYSGETFDVAFGTDNSSYPKKKAPVPKVYHQGLNDTDFKRTYGNFTVGTDVYGRKIRIVTAKNNTNTTVVSSAARMAGSNTNYTETVNVSKALAANNSTATTVASNKNK